MLDSMSANVMLIIFLVILMTIVDGLFRLRKKPVNPNPRNLINRFSLSLPINL